MSASAQKRLIGKERLLDIMAARAFAYSFLSRSLSEEPGKDFIKLLVDEELLDSFPNIEDNALLKEGHESITFFLRDPDLLTEAGIDNLIGQYNRIFIGLGRKKSISPYESVYVSPDRLVFQEETMRVRAAYAKHDLQPKRLQQEPDDHISLELEFMQKLSEKALKEMRSNRFHKARRILRDQSSFLEDHLLKWAPQMAGEMSQKTDSAFFGGVARMLSGYLAADKEVVDTLIEEVRERIKRHKEKNEIKSV